MCHLGLLADKDLVEAEENPGKVRDEEEDDDPHKDDSQVVFISEGTLNKYSLHS